MKKNKVLLTKTGDTYNCKYVLDQTDITDEKVDKGVSDDTVQTGRER